MWIPYVALAAVWCGSVLTLPQGGPPGNVESTVSQGSYEADGFVFDGPADGPSSRLTGSTTGATSSAPSRTTTTTTARTTSPASAQMNECTRMCTATPEYNPVCGSDGTLYNNPGLLNCAAFCGKDVTISYYGPCTSSNVRG